MKLPNVIKLLQMLLAKVMMKLMTGLKERKEPSLYYKIKLILSLFQKIISDRMNSISEASL